jgi:ribosomal protein S18 acetylase RimI-like enzyme
MLNIEIKKSKLEDIKYIIEWLKDPNTLKWYPMYNEREIEDAARFWISFVKYGAVLTAYYNKKACGLINLYLQPYQKFKHQCLFAIVVKEGLRGKGIGSRLLEEIQTLAKNDFNIKFLHLEVYENNPAVNLYKRHGFVKFGEQKNFIKNLDGKYMSKIFMQKQLID